MTTLAHLVRRHYQSTPERTAIIVQHAGQAEKPAFASQNAPKSTLRLRLCVKALSDLELLT